MKKEGTVKRGTHMPRENEMMGIKENFKRGNTVILIVSTPV